MADNHARDPGIADIIRYFDLPEHCAWHLLTDKEANVLYEEIKKCADPEHGFKYIAKNYYWITTKSGVDIPLKLKEPQELVYETIRMLRNRGRGVKLLIIKARQLFCSTLIEAYIAWLLQFNPNNRGLVVSYDDDHAAYLFSIVLHIYDQLPWWLRPMIGSRKYEEGIHLINPDPELRRLNPGMNSRMTVQGAKKDVGVAEGQTINSAHACLSPHTLVHTAGGVPKPICEVQPGDEVITSRGVIAKVKRLCKSPREHEMTKNLWMWGEFSPLSTTRDHKILCPEGFREAKDISAGDYVCRPVRKIQETDKERRFTNYRIGGSHVGSRVQSTHPVEMNFDWGWVLGFYLAEGTVKIGPHAFGFTEVTFGIDRDEEQMVESALRKVLPADRHIGHYRFTSRTSVLRVSWAGFARFIEDSCGHGDTKHVPDWAWNAGRDFCRGLIAGYIQGDGHLRPGENSLSACSVRPAIAIQMRDLAASLGYGWSSIQYREAGVHYGRNCRSIWNWVMVSGTAKRCKDDLGWGDPSIAEPQAPLHWYYSDDGKFVNIEVSASEDGFAESFFDLEVDAPEHDFCTIHCCVKNSEFGSWDPAKARRLIVSDFRWALPDEPNTFAVLETRVRQASKFAERLWESQVSLGEVAAWHPLFMPIYFDKSHFIPPRAGWKPDKPELSVKERAAEEWCVCSNCSQIRPTKFGGDSVVGTFCKDCGKGEYSPYILQDGQMRWLWEQRVNAEGLSEKAVTEMQQSLATNPQEAFASVTETIFSRPALDWVAATTRTGYLGRGYMASDGTFHAPRREAGGQESAQCRADRCMQDHRGETDRYLTIWQPPTRGVKYAIGVDPAAGLGGKRDYSVITVHRIGQLPEPDMQVATYRCNTISAWHLADLANAIGRWYNNGLMVVDYTNQQTVGDRLLNYFHYPNLYRWIAPDALTQHTNRWHWLWNNKNKESAWAVLDGWLRDHSFIAKDPVFAREMRNYQRLSDGSIGAPDSKNEEGLGDEFDRIHDDTVTACISVIVASHQQDPRRPLDLGSPQQEGLRSAGEWRGTCLKCEKSFEAMAPCERDRCPFCGSIWLRWKMEKPEGIPLGFKFDEMGGTPGIVRDRYGATQEFSFGEGGFNGQGEY